MPQWWNPGELWKGEDAYIIGGGDSLRSFDWGSIAGRHTIACNSNFILGHWVVEILLFGDWMWWFKIGRLRLPEFGGKVVGCYGGGHGHTLSEDTPSWLLRMDRWPAAGYAPPGKGALGWMGSTGAMAINLALVLGASRVFLLGFDMELGGSKEEGRENKANWHDLRYEKENAQSYPRFIQELKRGEASRHSYYPDRQIVNVSNNSKLELFPKQSLADHFGRKEKR